MQRFSLQVFAGSLELEPANLYGSVWVWFETAKQFGLVQFLRYVVWGGGVELVSKVANSLVWLWFDSVFEVCNLLSSCLQFHSPSLCLNLEVVWGKTGLCGSIFAFGPKWFGSNWAEIFSGLVQFRLMI